MRPETFRTHEGDDQLNLFPEATKPSNWFLIRLAVTIVGILFVLSTHALAQEHRHPLVNAEAKYPDFYSTWNRPDDPKVSCCNKYDCFPAEIRHEDGKLYVKSQWDGEWVEMPPEKIDRSREAPDGQNHACLSAPTYEDGAYYKGNRPICFMYGQGS